MKSNLLVTLADKNYIDQAKQLFSSVYFNAGWRGDYMLLAHQVPDEDLKWFSDKGILVKKCEPLFDRNFGFEKKKSPIPVNKFYLFIEYFKKWQSVVYLDSDIIVRKSLERLTHTKSFAATRANTLGDNFDFTKNPKIEKDWSKEYDFKKRTFNSGVMVFNTDLIENDSFRKLVNMFFYRKWEKLPFIYNFNPLHIGANIIKNPTEICNLPAIVLHFFDDDKKPWLLKNIFYKEWKYNLDRADNIDLTKRISVEIPTFAEVQKYSSRIRKLAIYRRKEQKIIERINRSMGEFGIFLRNKYPKIYYFIKNIKEK